MRRRYGLGFDEPQTLDQIGEVFGVTRERIRQIEGKTLKKLRASETAAALHIYLIDGPTPAIPVEDQPAEGMTW